MGPFGVVFSILSNLDAVPAVSAVMVGGSLPREPVSAARCDRADRRELIRAGPSGKTGAA
ncbi:hypothetical protein [Halorubrum sp. N11]|uniref:hypothetical protein n=1 Tax=Halorubrum sp. N11 TaxID=3402276 RepID=UPI003EB85F7D